jgi:hypothetical protein
MPKPIARLKNKKPSAWQSLIEKHRVANQLSIDTLAKLTDQNAATLYSTLSRTTYTPPKYRYTAKLNLALAAALHLDPDVIMQTYQQSVMIDPAPTETAHKKAMAFDSLAEVIRTWPSKTIPVATIKQLLKI